jgi:transposase
MMIIGCDLHTRYQQIAMLDTETGELVERRLEHESGEARAFYAALSGPVRVGIEATGYTHWFGDLLAELGHELWMGDAAKIRASVIRKQKTDARDAAHLLDLLRAGGPAFELAGTINNLGAPFFAFLKGGPRC